MKNKLIIALMFIIAATVACGLYWVNAGGTDEKLGSAITYTDVKGNIASSTNVLYDAIGDQTATTTNGVSFPKYTSGTTTYSWKIGKGVDEAVFYYQAQLASTTAEGGGGVHTDFVISSDDECHTATTTTSGNVAKKSEINWYDAAPLLANFTYSASRGAGTTTQEWLPNSNKGTIYRLTGLATECVALKVSATGTVLYVGMITKNDNEY